MDFSFPKFTNHHDIWRVSNIQPQAHVIFFSFSKFPLIWFRSQLGLLPPYSKLFIITSFYLSKNVAISCLFRYGILNIIIRIHGTVNKLDVYNTSKRRLLLNPFRPSTFKPFFSAA